MTTAIAVYTSDGIVGRCDAKCHNATSVECDCVCGGRLHGSGSRAIALNTAHVLGDDWKEKLEAGIEHFAAAHGLDPSELRTTLYEPRTLFEEADVSEKAKEYA